MRELGYTRACLHCSLFSSLTYRISCWAIWKFQSNNKLTWESCHVILFPITNRTGIQWDYPPRHAGFKYTYVWFYYRTFVAGDRPVAYLPPRAPAAYLCPCSRPELLRVIKHEKHRRSISSIIDYACVICCGWWSSFTCGQILFRQFIQLYASYYRGHARDVGIRCCVLPSSCAPTYTVANSVSGQLT